jgi:hypothetical protein
MKYLTHGLVATLAILLFLAVPLGGQADAAGGNASAQTVPLYRAACAPVISGSTVGTARFSADDQGGVPGGVEIRIGVTSGLTRATYSISVLTADCRLITAPGTLVTDDSGRGDQDVHVPGTIIPSGAVLLVQLSAPGDTLASASVSTSGF